jgi:hypothetical protein
MRHTASIVCSFVLLALVSMTAPGNKTQAQKPTTAPSASGYHLLKKIEVGGEGGWDYLIVDGAARRLYVSRGTRVMVFDADTGPPSERFPTHPGCTASPSRMILAAALPAMGEMRQLPYSN